MTSVRELNRVSAVGSRTRLAQTGLTAAEVAARRHQGLTNSVHIKTSRSLRDIVVSNLFSPVNLVLYAIGIAMILARDLRSALATVGLLFFNSLVGMAQEVSVKRQLDKIALLTHVKVKVVRDGKEQMIDADDLVLGDVLELQAGDQIPVDGELLDSSQIEADESLLTGESDLVRKTAGDTVRSGSTCVTGAAVIRATAVGESSFANKLTRNARQFKLERTPLQRDVNRLLRLLLLVILNLVLLAVLSLLFIQVSPSVWLQAISVIAGMVSAGLLTMITLNYSWGAIRIGRSGALVQQINAVEALSNVTVLCMDKTGTLTTNEIQYRESYPVGVEPRVLEALLGDFAASAATVNKTTRALIDALPGTRRRVVDEVPFASARKWSALAFDDPVLKGAYVLGAAEMLGGHLSLPTEVQGQLDTWSNAGLRVLAFGRNPDAMTLHNAAGEPDLPHLSLLGILCLGDELRTHLSETLGAFRRNRVELKIISGDNSETVRALARQAGFEGDLKTVSGAELAAMSPSEFSRAAAEATIFGRVTPEQKAALVGALQQHIPGQDGREGRFVAMIGDGVNDVPSLKRANLGIAMEGGSTAARSVAAMVLRHDSFEALPPALTEGQRILSSVLSVVKLYFVSVFALVPLIVGTATLGLGFPYTILQSTLASFFARGAPPFVLALTARPSHQRENVMRGIMRFTLPAAHIMYLFGLLVYVGTYLVVQNHLLALAVTPQMIRDLAQLANDSYAVDTPASLLRAVSVLAAQTTLTVFLSLSGILLMLFAAPSIPWFAVISQPNRSRLPMIAAGVLILAFIGVLLIPSLSRAFQLLPLPPSIYIVIGLVVIVWILVQRETWRRRLLERFLDREL